MFTFHHVLFPVDFSSGCQALAPTVRRMVEVWSVDVTLLRAIDEERWLGGRHELERLMRRMKAIAGEGPQARYFGFRLERGQPAVRILEYPPREGVHDAVRNGSTSVKRRKKAA